MQLAGSFRQYPLPDILELIESGQRSGRLVAGRAAPMAHVYFVNGQWVHGERLGTGLTLAEQLIQAGIITEAQLAAGLSLRPEDTLTLPDSQLVRMLISAGLMTQEQLRTWATSDALGMLTIMLSWTDGEFRFEEGVPVPAGQLVLPLPLGTLLADALAALRGPGVTATPSLPVEAVLAFVDVELDRADPIQLTRDQWRLLTMVDGQLPIWAIADVLQAPASILQRVAGELVAAELAVVVGEVSTGEGQ